ncbi:MAG: methylated-DNA--[protein]-cysteine S-methyltransferase [Deltaproteobacteria bacterium]|nr:methylated-DNA--[protein]-cysteine S-methyltransferase [Deltaproteobacteria bacterium]
MKDTAALRSHTPACVLRVDRVESPIGPVTFAVSDAGVCALALGEGWERLRRRVEKAFGLSAPGAAARFEDDSLPALRRSLEAYFAGRTDALEDIDVDLRGTDFQKSVWAALRTVRPGTTASYGDIARRIDNPKAVRAVGLANGRNPVSLIVPCHRVIGADGSLTGYGFGLERKRWLLEHEGALLT